MMAKRSTILGWAGILAATMSGAADGDKVRGTVSVGTTKVALTTGMAVAYKTPIGDRVSVVLSDKPVDATAFAEDTRTGPGEPLVPAIFEGAWKAQHFAKRLSGFTFTIGPNGLMLDEYLVGGRNNTFGIGPDNYTLEVKSRSPRFVGTIKTKTPVVDVGAGAGLEATFDLAVTPR
jgi:hypothetical protein